MKRLLFLTAVAALLATVASFSLAHWLARRATPASVNIHEVAWLKSKLNLTDAQVAQLDALQREFATRTEDCCKKHCAARFRLSDELAKAAPNLTTAQACVEWMSAAQAESERATLDHILRVRSVLTPEQQAHYAALLHDQMCNACPLGLHKP